MAKFGFRKISSIDGDDTSSFEYGLMTDSEAVTRYEALVYSSGRLTKCGATATPEVIAQASATAGTSVEIPFTRVTEEQFYEVVSTATVAATLVGSKVTLGTDGGSITATTSSGVFEVTNTDGATTNSNVIGMFRR